MFSSGWFLEKRELKDNILQLHEKALEIFDGLEIHLTNKFRREFYSQPEIYSSISDSMINFHLPSTIDSIDTYNKISKLVDIYEPKFCVVHPRNKNLLNWYKSYNCELLIENMDKEKDYAVEISDILNILEKFNSRLCLDLQHCYEQGGKNYFKELFEKNKENIGQLHVSGQNKHNNHSLVTKSNNKESIKEMLTSCHSEVNYVVLEGEVMNYNDMYKEKELIEEYV